MFNDILGENGNIKKINRKSIDKDDILIVTVDTGNMPASKKSIYLKNVKDEIKKTNFFKDIEVLVVTKNISIDILESK